MELARKQQLELPLDPLGDEWVRTAQQHARVMHEGGKGVLYVGRGGRGGAINQKPYPVEVALEVARHYDGQQNVFLSAQRFRGARTLTDLLSLSSLFADVDFYNRERYELWHPYMVFEEALEALHRAGIPEPTLSIGSGRGLTLMWLHEPIRRSGLPRWQACQKYLWETLRPLGADRFAQDGARFLRLVGTKNRRPRSRARPVEALAPVGESYTFDDLAAKILPLTQEQCAEVRQLAIERANRDAKRPREAKQRTPAGFNERTLLERRLTDYQRLRELRWFGPLPPRHRDKWMLLAGSAVSYLVEPVCPQLVTRELCRLAKDAIGPAWGERQIRNQMHGVIKRTRLAAAGVRFEHDGELWDPRYRWSNQRIIEDLEITAAEEREMLTIFSHGELLRRDRERKEAERRAEGKPERKGQWHSEARRLALEGLSDRKIAKRLGVSHEAVRKLLRLDPRFRVST